MKITKTQRLILYSLGQFYRRLNQPLKEKPVKIRTKKITFIEMLIDSNILTKQERALYKNIETLENKKLINYDAKKVRFTEQGLKILDKIDQEIEQFVEIKKYFKEAKRPKRRLQTMIRQSKL